MTPLEPYLVGIALGLFVAAFWGAYGQSKWLSGAMPVRRSERQRQELVRLGRRAVILAGNIGEWLHNPFLYNDYASYTAQIYSLIVEFNRSGFRVPPVGGNMAVDAKMELARRYFVIVGHLLTSGLIPEAQAAADRAYNETVTVGSDGLPQALQGFESKISH